MQGNDKPATHKKKKMMLMKVRVRMMMMMMISHWRETTTSLNPEAKKRRRRRKRKRKNRPDVITKNAALIHKEFEVIGEKQSTSLNPEDVVNEQLGIGRDHGFMQGVLANGRSW
jgi:hypothetical protein